MASSIMTKRKELRTARKRRRKENKNKLRSTKVSYKKRRPTKTKR
jgi:hypothetical protein